MNLFASCIQFVLVLCSLGMMTSDSYYWGIYFMLTVIWIEISEQGGKSK